MLKYDTRMHPPKISAMPVSSKLAGRCQCALGVAPSKHGVRLMFHGAAIVTGTAFKKGVSCHSTMAPKLGVRMSGFPFASKPTQTESGHNSTSDVFLRLSTLENPLNMESRSSTVRGM